MSQSLAALDMLDASCRNQQLKWRQVPADRLNNPFRLVRLVMVIVAFGLNVCCKRRGG